MISVTKHRMILEKRDFPFETEGVLNPAVLKENGTIHLLYRAVAEGNRSTVGYCRLSDPVTVAERWDKPFFEPEGTYDSQGVEDPRIVAFDGTYYLSYCAYDGESAFSCIAVSDDLKTWKRYGIMVPQLTGDAMRAYLKKLPVKNIKYLQQTNCGPLVWDKNLVLFPRRINGKIHFLHRIKPGIQLVAVESLEEINTGFWQDYFTDFTSHIVLDPKFPHELSYIGNGAPPIETADGWLLVYHGVHDTVEGFEYVACVALLDLEDPRKEISRLPYALFSPDQQWEKEGYVNNVCFPTGTVVVDDTLFIYYGAADERIGVASVSMQALLTELRLHRIA